MTTTTTKKLTVEVEQGLANDGYFTVYQVGRYDKDGDNYTIERKIDWEWRTDRAAVQAEVDRRNSELVLQWRAEHDKALAKYEKEKKEWETLKAHGLREGEWMRNPPSPSAGASRYEPDLPWDHYTVMETEIRIG